MMKQFLGHALASSLLLAGAVTQVYAVDDTNFPANTARIQRSFVNLSFEQFTSYPPEPVEKGWNSSPWAIYNQKQVIGWRTTAATTTYNGMPYRGIEIWNEKRSGSTASKAQAGDYYAELNAHSASTLYQNICLLPEDTFQWSLQHRGRNNVNETMKFIIANKITDSAESGISAGAITVTQLKDISGTLTAVYNTWSEHKSKAPVTVSDIISKAGVFAFGFQATNGSNEGNFLDNIKINLKPAIEFSAASGEMYENNGKYNPVNFKIIGLVESDFTVSFVIDNASVPNPAVHGQDYKIYQTNANGTYTEIPVDFSDPTRPTFNYTVKYNSGLDYANGVVVSGLVVKMENNDLLDGDKVIPFGLNKIQSGSVSLMGTEVCGNAPISTFNYLIKDEDTDLAVTKTLNQKAPLPSDTVSYDIIFENKAASNSTALDVVLKDELLANLIKDAKTELTCEAVENEGVTGVCPTFTSATDAAVKLFSTDGLALGSVPAKTKFKFTLSNLKVAATDSSTADYLGYIANKAVVTTTSHDINLANNESIAKNLYASETDLFNNDAGKTGTGLFVIDNGGQPLWTQAMVSNQAFFPLKIKNSGKLQQDYQLYASRTAVNKERSDSNLSPLVSSTIQPYTDRLKIEFFDVSSAQCKAGLGGAKQVTQLTVPSNSEGEVCAAVTILDSAQDSHDIWFAIESLQSGLGDVIRDAVTSNHLVQRLMELVNDQTAQVNAGGTYVFPHRLINQGSVEEKNITFTLTPVRADDFLYTLFEDKNKNGILDAEDIMISNRAFSLLAKAELALLIKVQAPATATNGMSSQVKLEAVPDNNGQSMSLAVLSNLDSITVGTNQLKIHKTQFMQPGCTNMDAAAVKAAGYSISNVTMGVKDCLIYRITVTNIGDSKLSNVAVNDMYPAYTNAWKSGSVLPMTSSGEAVQDDASKVKTTFSSLLPQEEKSLYFGIKMQ